MGRQRLYNPAHPNSDSEHRLHGSVAAGRCSPEEIPADLSETPEDHPVFIARMPKLEEPRPLRTAVALPSVWSRMYEIKNGITDQQQIFTLWCIIALLVCMLFWSMANKPSPNSSEFTQMETSRGLDYEAFRTPSPNESRLESTESFAPRESGQPVRRWDNEGLPPALPMSSIDLSESPETASPTFRSHQQYVASPAAPVNPTHSQARSAWDRDAYSAPSASHSPVPVNPWNSEPDSTPDFSVFAAPNDGTSQAARGEFPVRDNEPQVQQVQYHQNSAMAPGYNPHYGESVPSYSQRDPQSPSPYGQSAQYGPASPVGPAGMHSSATTQYPSSSQQRQGRPYDSSREAAYQHPVPDSGSHTPHYYYEEQIPATFSNQTYRNPGTPQTVAPSEYHAGTGMNPNTAWQQGFNGQYHAAPQNTPQYTPQYNQPTYGTATLPANPWNR